MINYDGCPPWVRERLENEIFPRLPQCLLQALERSGLKIRYLIHENSRFTQYHEHARGCKAELTLGVYMPFPHMLIIKDFTERTIVHELVHAFDHLLGDETGHYWSEHDDAWKALYDKHCGPAGDGRVVGDGYASDSVAEYFAESAAAAMGFDERQQRRLQRMCPATFNAFNDILFAVENRWLEPRIDHTVKRCHDAGTATTDTDTTSSDSTTLTKDHDACSSTPLQEAAANGT